MVSRAFGADAGHIVGACVAGEAIGELAAAVRSVGAGLA